MLFETNKAVCKASIQNKAERSFHSQFAREQKSTIHVREFRTKRC